MSEPGKPRPDLTYGGYLQLNKILHAQKLESDPPEHDELLFVIVHQVFELWFKQMLHELEALRGRLDAGEIHLAMRSFERLNELLKIFDAQLGVLETMSPSEFAKFRELLRPASGFQSWQFREVEYICGSRDEKYLKMFDDQPEIRKRLEARLEEVTVWDSFCLLLDRLGMECGDPEAQRTSIVTIYSDNNYTEMRTLCERMIEFDERFALWRQHHVRMAERMIGSKPGTGQKLVEYAFGSRAPMGTMGVEYLQSTLGKRFFPVLWEARTEM